MAVEEFRIPLEVMMENAGRALATLAMDEIDLGRVLVLAGTGGNGGGGLAAARHLRNRGATVEAALTKKREAFRGVPALQLRMLEAMEVPITDAAVELPSGELDLVIDAMVGYGLMGGLRGPAADLARAANESGMPVMSLDIPSGLNGDTGLPGDPCVKARWTLTLALPKVGLLDPHAAEHVGSLFLADVAIPPEIYRHFGAERPPFRGASYIKL